MEVDSDDVRMFKKLYEEVKSDEELTDLELEVKIEKSDETENIKTEVFEEVNNLTPFQIIGEKRKNPERWNVENENKKIKEEFIVFEELDDNHRPQETEEINFDDLINQVIPRSIQISDRFEKMTQI